MQRQYQFLTFTLFFLLLAGCNRPALQTPVPVSPTAPVIQTVTRQPRILPDAVYLISNGQIWRIAADGRTIAQITSAEQPVVSVAVSPTGQHLAFVQGNVLWRANSAGRAAVPLVSGPLPALQETDQLGSVLWSPDGLFIAYTQQTLHLAPANGGEPLNIQPTLRGTLPLSLAAWQVRAVAWSTDSQKLLVALHANNATHFAVYHRTTNTLVVLPNEQGWADVSASWGVGDAYVYLSGRQYLWLADASTGVVVPLLTPPTHAEPFQLSFVRQAPNGDLLGFASSPDETAPGLRMYQTAIDGMSNAVFLRNDSHLPQAVLWADDLSGAVLLGKVLLNNGEQGEQLWWLPSDNSTAVLLPIVGSQLQWAHISP